MLEMALEEGGYYRYPKVQGFVCLRQGLAMCPRLASNSQKSCNLHVSVSQIADSEPGTW